MAAPKNIREAEQLQQLDSVSVTGSRPAAAPTIDYNAFPVDRFSGGGSTGGRLREAFAPPIPPVLPPLPELPAVKIIDTPIPKAPAPTFDPIPALGRVLTPLIGFLWPGNMGRPRTGELDEPLPGDPRRPIPLPNVDVVGTRPPRTPIDGLPPLPFEWFEPPNWRDLIGDRIDVAPQPRVPFFDPLGPGPQPVRIVTPRIDPTPGLDPFEPMQPERRADPSPVPRTPDVVPAPIPGIRTDPIGDPFSQPISRPGDRQSPRPTPRPTPIGRPEFDDQPIGDPLWDAMPRPGGPSPVPRPTPRSPFLSLPTMPVIGEPLLPGVDPRTLAKPSPDKTGGCNCPKARPCSDSKKKKKKKKRKPRAICYRGTFVERANGLSKKRLEQVPCK